MDSDALDLGTIHASWNGWRFRGDKLIAPDGQKITQRRLSGLLWRDAAELRRAGYASRERATQGRRERAYGAKVKVVIVEIADVRIDGRTAS